MRKGGSVSLIIATYNWPEALALCLYSILRQTILPAEVIVADDGSDERTQKLIQEFARKTPFPVFHEWHEDNGFRKTRILNKAIRRTASPYIIQIDGDVVAHPHFIEDHLYRREEGYFIRGTRANLNTKITTDLLMNGNLSKRDKFWLIRKYPANSLRLSPVMAGWAVRKESSGRKVKGCNMSFWKKDLVAVNGYDNSLQGWGHEDEELSWRLVNAGVKKKIVKFSAIVYHLHHRQLSRTEEPSHRELLQTIITQKTIRTRNGMVEIEKQP